MRKIIALLLLLLPASVLAMTPTEGLWWNPSESGRGYTISIQDDIALVTIFIYDGNGNPTYYQASGVYDHATNSITAPLAEFHGGQCFGCAYSEPTHVLKGEMTIAFTSMNSAILRYPGGSTPIQPFIYGYAQKLDYFFGEWSLTLAGGAEPFVTEWLLFTNYHTTDDGTRYVMGHVDGFSYTTVALGTYDRINDAYVVAVDDGSGYTKIYMFPGVLSNDRTMVGVGGSYPSWASAPDEPEYVAAANRLGSESFMRSANSYSANVSSTHAGASRTAAMHSNVQQLAHVLQSLDAKFKRKAGRMAESRWGAKQTGR